MLSARRRVGSLHGLPATRPQALAGCAGGGWGPPSPTIGPGSQGPPGPGPPLAPLPTPSRAQARAARGSEGPGPPAAGRARRARTRTRPGGIELECPAAPVRVTVDWSDRDCASLIVVGRRMTRIRHARRPALVYCPGWGGSAPRMRILYVNGVSSTSVSSESVERRSRAQMRHTSSAHDVCSRTNAATTSNVAGLQQMLAWFVSGMEAYVTATSHR